MFKCFPCYILILNFGFTMTVFASYTCPEFMGCTGHCGTTECFTLKCCGPAPINICVNVAQKCTTTSLQSPAEGRPCQSSRDCSKQVTSSDHPTTAVCCLRANQEEGTCTSVPCKELCPNSLISTPSQPSSTENPLPILPLFF